MEGSGTSTVCFKKRLVGIQKVQIMKKISKKKLEQILTNALVRGKIAGANKRAAFKMPEPNDEPFLWDGRPLE